MLMPKLNEWFPLIQFKESPNSRTGALRRDGAVVFVALVSVKPPDAKLPRLRLKPPWFPNCPAFTSPKNRSVPPVIPYLASLTRLFEMVQRQAVTFEKRTEV